MVPILSWCACVWCSSGLTAQAQCLDFSTVEAGESFVDTATVRDFYINTSTFTSRGYDAEEVEAIIVAAADTWNQSGTSGTFRYLGRTSLGLAPTTASACASRNHTESVIVMDDNTGGAIAAAHPRCRDAMGAGSTFGISIYATTDNGVTQLTWSLTPGSGINDLDLASVATHELGHTFDLGHPVAGVAATMQTTGGSPAGNPAWRKTFRRDLRSWDIDCANQFGGNRVDDEYLDVKYARQWFYEQAPYYSPFYSSHEAIKASWGSSWSSSAAWLDDGCLRYGGSCVSFDSLLAASAPKVVDWLEHSSDRRIYFGLSADEGVAGWGSSHAVKVVGTSYTFISPNLEECTAMTGFLTCASSAPIYSARRVGSTYNDTIDRTVFVWTRSDPASENDFRRVRVAAGRVDSATLPVGEYFDANATSIVGPDVACETNGAVSRDCIVAYVPHNDPERRVWVTIFDLDTTATGYEVSIPFAWQTPIQTGSDLTIWFQDDSAGGRFWIAVRSIGANQPVELWSSSKGNGLTWTYRFNTISSLVGPDSISQLSGSLNGVVNTF